ncbi:Clavaminate synthase-like protein [Fomitopsis serialis]|uniref:Clavaminate synthase-like protein n=1 Tax=Fomitopsis serialis TaxID=139415 RepID=UPI002007A8F6|nr:Clavaminate synthase-like protein [Neoantrodia serialis]KAH9928942.1 Clavaminate synthase-like protein [Neoantrodia serialis]
MPGLTTLPPFPENVSTHPLLVVDYELLKAGDQEEIDKFWKAATTLGFWYLKNHGADELVTQMFDMGSETMDLPFEEKLKFEQGDNGMSFGYKAPGANATDESGARDTVEFINISQDDALAWPKSVHRSYPSTVNARMERTIQPFVQHSAEVNLTLMEILAKKLGFEEGLLSGKHRLDESSGSETRCIKNPPRPGGISEEKAALGAHTDFGSMTFLHNRLGGLQVMPPGSDKWQYIKPIPGHAVCNLGDAMHIFSGGILKSNLHRVVPAPGAQAAFPRWSLAMFTRPGDSVVLRALTEESEVVAEAVKGASDASIFESHQTSEEWFARRIKYQRSKNQQGPETWRQSRGTEHRPDAA